MPAYDNPLDALRKAQSIAPEPEIKMGGMPLGPGGFGSAIAGLSRARPVVETLGERAAEFTPIGGEAMYNAGKAMLPRMQQLIQQGTTAVQKSPFQALRDAGAFAGERLNTGFREASGGLSEALQMLRNMR